MRKLYLDIDGVLLTTKNTRPAERVEEFIDFIVSNFDCYWLTTHCRDGNSESVLVLLSQYFSNDTVQKLKAVKPTVWSTLKTEAIDFSSSFFWLDDYVFNVEKDILRRNHCLNSLIIVDLNNRNELFYIINKCASI